MSIFRRDQIPFVLSCFVNFIWSFSSFLSVEMIKLYSYYFMNNINYPGIFYGVFAISFIFLIFLKFNKIFTSVMVIWFNFFIHLLLVIFILFPVKNRIFLIVLFGIWSHLYALNLISSIYLSSYNLGGLHGLIIGSTMAYYMAYFLLHAVEHPSDFNIASRKATCNWFIILRFIASVLSFKYYKEYLEYFFYFEYRDSIKRISMTDMFKWVDGKPVEIMSSVRVSELMPSSIDYSCVKYLFNKDDIGTVYLGLFYLSILTTSFYSPPFSPTPLVLSIFVKNDVYFVEFLGGLVGVIIAILFKRFVPRSIILVYFVHYFFAICSYLGFNTYFFDLYKHKNLLYAYSFFSSTLGTFVLVYSFINFIMINSMVKCVNQKKRNLPDKSNTCCVNDISTCLCYNKNANESCSSEHKENKLKCVNIWVAWNNHSTYRDWNYSDCEFCLSQNYNNNQSSCTCSTAAKGSAPESKIRKHCCSCSCPSCDGRKDCNCKCNGKGTCDNSCCCKRSGNANYLLRNCVVSCCPYCDMCMLLECVKIPCVCECSHVNHRPRNSVQSSQVGKKEQSLTKIKLNLELSTGKHIYLCTYADSPDLKTIQKFFCCCSPNQCEGQRCCIKCCKRCKDESKSCGKHFNISDFKVSSCCHYNLKIWISMKEMNSTFHIGQKPFDNKYDQINSLVFTNSMCRDCCEGSNCCEKPGCKGCTPVDVVKIVEDTTLSQSGGSIRLNCNKTSGMCKCCCCCGDNSACKCSCSSSKNKDCECPEKKCRAIKILPTNLPYQFRQVDIKRNEVVSSLGFAMVLFCLFKLILAFIFSIINQNDALKLNIVLKDFSNVNGITIKTFPMDTTYSDTEYALKRVGEYEGAVDHLINYAIDLEIKDLEQKTRSIKEMMDELNSLKFDRWLQDIEKAPYEVIPIGYTKLKFYRHLNSYLEYALKQHCLKTADRIFVYFNKFPGRWETEWSDFERRFLQNLKMYTNYSLSLNSVGYFDTNLEFQKLINNRQSLILSELNSKNDDLTTCLSRNRYLLEKFKKAKPHKKLPKYIDLWQYRVNLIKDWAGDNTLFLNWTPFVVSMDRILLWDSLFRSLYIKAYKEKYGNSEK